MIFWKKKTTTQNVIWQPYTASGHSMQALWSATTLEEAGESTATLTTIRGRGLTPPELVGQFEISHPNVVAIFDSFCVTCNTTTRGTTMAQNQWNCSKLFLQDCHSQEGYNIGLNCVLYTESPSKNSSSCEWVCFTFVNTTSLNILFWYRPLAFCYYKKIYCYGKFEIEFNPSLGKDSKFICSYCTKRETPRNIWPIYDK